MLPAGKNKIRLLSRTEGYNLNWFQFSLISGIESAHVSEMALYPNPAHDSFFLKFNQAANRQIEIFNMKGQLIQQTTSKHLQTNIDIQHIQPGLYIVKVADKKNTFSKKLQVI